MEEKILEILLSELHFYLMIGIFSIILMLQWMKPVKKTLFSEKWKFLVAPMNLALSAIGIFGLGMTNADKIGTKIVIMLVISAAVTFTYEAIAKPLIDFLKKRLIKQGG